MSEHYLGLPDCIYICGRPFTSEDGQHNPGEEVPNAPSFPLLETLVNNGLLYRVFENDFSKLPPHVYNAVMTQQEAQAAIEGDPSIPANAVDWEPSPAMEQAILEAEVQAEIHSDVLTYADEAHDQRGYTDAEQVLIDEQEQVNAEQDAQGQPLRN
jgi:hypothetical protein